jgi:calcineurin-like phosphoesterase family protein
MGKLMITDTENLWIISDTHFEHENINKYHPIRNEIAGQYGYEDPFQYILDKWNEKIKPDDEVLHLGDFAWWKIEDIKPITRKLNGKVTLIQGNHDRIKSFEKTGWDIINKPVLNIKGFNNKILDNINMGCYVVDAYDTRILFSHRPLIITEREEGKNIAEIMNQVFEDIYIKYECDINIHGHTHSRDVNDDLCLNASVEKTYLQPIRLYDLLKKTKLK